MARRDGARQPSCFVSATSNERGGYKASVQKTTTRERDLERAGEAMYKAHAAMCIYYRPPRHEGFRRESLFNITLGRVFLKDPGWP